MVFVSAQLGVQTTPAAAAILETCYLLTLSATGNGMTPTAVPVKSAACVTEGQYVAGEVVTLTALPDLGYRVSSWVGTADDLSTALTNTVTMPALDHAVTVNYQVLASSGGLSCANLEPKPLTASTGIAPQAKVWTYANTWWAVFPTDATGASSAGTWLWKLNGTTWTEVLKLSDRTDVRADVRTISYVVHVLLYAGANSQLVTLQYSAGVYEPWSSRPTPTAISLPSSGVASIDEDPTGRLWLVTRQDGTTSNKIVVYYSDNPFTTFQAPIELADGVASDDIAAVVHMGNKTGVLWSNQNTKRFGFRYHLDTDPATTWAADEAPAYKVEYDSDGGGMADDEINLKATSDGTMYAAVKTSFANVGSPRLALLIRRPAGTWDDLYSVDTAGARGAIEVDAAHSTLTYLYTEAEGYNNIVYKQSSISPISFGSRQTLRSGSFNDVSSTKDNYYSGLVMLYGSSTQVAGQICVAAPTTGADLAITKTDGSTTAEAGSAVTYTIQVTNNGPQAVTGATVTDALPTSLPSATWTCSGTGSGTCPASGTGDLNELVNLPVSASVTFTVTGTLNIGAAGTLINTASVTPPDGVTDPLLVNNSATDTDTIIPSGTHYTLTIVSDHGTVTKNPDQPTYLAGTHVLLTATPAIEYNFTGWSVGSCLGTDPCDVLMDSDKTVTASYAIKTFTLTYSAGSNGTLTGSSPQTVNYGASGSAVTAVPNTGYRFTGWSDGVLTASRTDTNVTANVTATANFELIAYTLTINSANGTVTKNPDQPTYLPGTHVLLTANPATGYDFTGWSGDDCTGTAPCDLVMNADKTVTANYLIKSFSLTYAAGSNGSLTGNPSQTVNYGASGTQVTAVPNTGYHFTSWSDAVLTAARTDGPVTGPINVTASFAINTYTLTYGAGGHGTISGTTPQTVTHGASGAPVTAVPSPGWTFTKWSDNVTTATRTDSNVTADLNVSAVWSQDHYTLTVNTAHGTVTKNPNHATYTYGDQVVVTVTSVDSGYVFVGWSGAGCTGTAPCTITMNSNQTVTANYRTSTHTLTYNAGTGGSISGTTPQTVADGGSGTAVTAVPNTGYHFVAWSDGPTTATRTDTNVIANMTVTAIFAIDTHTLTVISPHGTVTKNPDQTSYNYGTSVIVSATADPDWTFLGWDGAGCSGTDPCTILMDADKTVTATYRADLYTISGNTGVGGVTLSYTDGTPKTVTSNPGGEYTITVPYLWSGTVTPSLADYDFQPTSRTYTDLAANQTHSYTAFHNLVDIYIAGEHVAQDNLLPGSRLTPRFARQNGPVQVTAHLPVFSSQRVHNVNGFVNEAMGVPTSELTKEYWFPWYDNLGMTSWIMLANPDTSATAHVTINIAGTDYGPYDVGPGVTVAKTYAIMNGPVHITSDINIFTSERVATAQGFVQETMGYPNNQLAKEYWFPWYDNLGMISWILVGNPSADTDAHVTITIAGSEVDGSPFTIPHGTSITPQFPVMNGPVHITSDINVFTSERVHGINGFVQETMGYPNGQLAKEYWFPWYDNLGMTSWILVGNPSPDTDANVTINIAGTDYGPFNIPHGTSITPQFPVMNGPVHITSDINVFTSERVHGIYGFVQETMGFANNRLAAEYWFPWYDDVTMMEWVLVGRP